MDKFAFVKNAHKAMLTNSIIKRINMFKHLTLLFILLAHPLYGLNVAIDNISGREVFIKFTGNNLVVNQTDASIPSGQVQTFELTSVSAGRIYFSFDKALSSNSPDGANPSDPDYHTRFDKAELTFDNNNGGKANLTAVDFYAIPLLLQTSIGSLTVSQFTLQKSTTGNALETALIGLAKDASQTKISNATETVRILSPVKAPTGYHSMKKYVNSTLNSALVIKGNYFSANGVEPYYYTGSIGPSLISLTMANKKSLSILVPGLYTNGVNENAIYTCNGVYYLDGNMNQPHFVSENDFYAAVYRDVISGYNYGYIGGQWGNVSSGWWGHPPYSQSNVYYNQYAATIAQLYPGAYGFPFSDRQKTMLADLGGSVDTLTITVLADNATPPIIPIPGTLNPQTGSTLYNAVLVSENDIQDAQFTFGGNICKAGWINNYHGGPQTNLNNGKAAQILNINAQEGYNKYDLIFGQNKYTVIVQVLNGQVVLGTIAGGGNANWSSPNLFIGGLQTNP